MDIKTESKKTVFDYIKGNKKAIELKLDFLKQYYHYYII
jgi:hypothetical protein